MKRQENDNSLQSLEHIRVHKRNDILEYRKEEKYI